MRGGPNLSFEGRSLFLRTKGPEVAKGRDSGKEKGSLEHLKVNLLGTITLEQEEKKKVTAKDDRVYCDWGPTKIGKILLEKAYWGKDT